MLTPADFQKIEVFADLEPSQCQLLCRKVADISVKAGEYVCYEGDERSLYGILEGRFEAVRLAIRSAGRHAPIPRAEC